MPEEELQEATEVADKPKGGALGLVIAIIAFLVAGAAIVLAITSTPDTSALEARIQAVEQSVQANTDSITTMMEDQRALDEEMENMIEEKIAEEEAEEEEVEDEEAEE